MASDNRRMDAEADGIDEQQPLLASSQPQPQSRLASAWQTTTAAVQVYRTELASRLAKATSSKRSRSDDDDDEDGDNPHAARTSCLRNPVVKACLWTFAALIALLVLLFAIETSHLMLSTLSTPSESQQAQILDEALVLKGPDSVRLLNISDDGIQVQVDGRLGLDPDRALDIWLGRRGRTSWWKKRDRQIVEWALAKVAGVKVELGQLTIAEPDWTRDVPTQDLDLIPSNKTHEKALVAAAPLPPHQPHDLLAFNIDPLLVPLPELLRTSSYDDDEPILGGNSTRRARLTMRPLNLTLLFKPVTPAPYLAQLAQHAVKHGNATLDIKVQSLSVRGLTGKQMGEKKRGSSWIPGLVSLGQRDIVKRVRQQIPKLDVGNSTDEFLNLTRYDFFEINGEVGATGQKALGIRAYAEAKNPLGSLLKGAVRYSLPFGVFLPAAEEDDAAGVAGGNKTKPVDTVLLAVIASDPFELDGQEKVQLQLEGRVVPPPPPSNDDDSGASAPSTQRVFSASSRAHTLKQSPSEAALGNFLSRFLRGDANTVYVRGGSPFEHPDPSLPGAGSPDLPGWLTSALSVMDVPISFPGSAVTDLIKNVTIQDLKIKTHPWSKEKLLFSGTILGELSMPGELAAVDVEIRYLWPDILIYDGKPPSMRHGGGGHGGDGDDDGGDDDDDDDEEYAATPSEDDGGEPLPSPLPKGAFGRVRPHTWANATTLPDPDDPSPHPRKLLRSQLVDVPFTVLPGRGSEFRAYTWKLVTGEGAETGIEGSSKVKIWNSGLGDLEISKLPVSGSFIVGKRGEDGGGE